MDNIFGLGLSEETIKAILSDIQKTTQQQMTKSYRPENPFTLSPDVDKIAKAAAEISKKYYDAYVKAGFTEEQAFELVKTVTDKNSKKG